MKKATWAGVVLATLATAVYAADLDLSDFDDEVMRSMDDSIKALDNNVAGQDAEAATADLRNLQQGIEWTAQYFANKPGAPEAPRLASEARTTLTTLATALTAKDFTAADDALRATARNCKACHDLYRSPEL
jgi:cytochrome c556